MKTITVIVAGKASIGKSTVAKLIRETLKSKGIDVSINDNLMDYNDSLENANVKEPKENTNVLIKTVTTNRSLELV